MRKDIVFKGLVGEDIQLLKIYVKASTGHGGPGSCSREAISSNKSQSITFHHRNKRVLIEE